MAITNASRVADFGSGIGTEGAVLQIDNTNKRIGIGTTNPQAMLQVGTAVTVYGNSGIVSATSFYGSGANLSGIFDASTDITVRNITGVAATFSGVVTYEDVTNVDSVGIVTAGKGFRATTGGLIVTAGVSTLSDGVNISGITTVGILTSYESITIKVGAGSTEVATALNTKASTGKAIAMAMVFG